MSLKEKAVTGVLWSFVGNFADLFNLLFHCY